MVKKIGNFNFIYVKDFYEISSIKIFHKLIKKENVIIIINSNETKNKFPIYKYLTYDETKKSKKYIRKEDRYNFHISHSIVNFLFMQWIGCEVEELPLKKGIFFKPYIDNEYQYKYNITHSKHCIAIIFSNLEVGIDVEYINRDIEHEVIIKGCFHKKEKERQLLNKIEFYRTWVAKEAYIKSIGKGLYKAIDTIYVEKELENYIQMYDEEEKVRQCVYIFEPFKNYIGGICINE